MVGLDAAGKTTILYKLKLGEIVTTIPTIGKHLRAIKALSCHSMKLQTKHANFHNFAHLLHLVSRL